MGFGKNDEENRIRQKRINFYERIGFTKLSYDLKWFNKLVLSLYVLNTSKNEESDEKILNNVFYIYYATYEKEKVDSNCQIIKLGK